MTDLLQQGSQKLTRLIKAGFRWETGRGVDAK